MQTLVPSRLASFDHMSKSRWLGRVLSYICKRPIQPNVKEYRELAEALVTGDPAMDKVIDWLMQNPAEHRQLFETALFEGLDALPEPIPELIEFFEQIMYPPAWFDESRLNDAVIFTHRLGVNNGFILRDLSLMVGYLYPGFNRPLILTGALKKHAGKRLAETTKWWVEITEIDGLKRFGSGFTSTIYVRFIHALVRHQLSRSEEWDTKKWGLPLNQFDLAMTNIAFSGVVLLGIRALAVFPNKHEVAQFLHFWKYVGWLMGVDEKWLVDNERDAWRLLYWMQDAHPESDESSLALGQSLSKEPFERRYQRMRSFQQKLAYHMHLEITQFFIGRKRMHKLGLEERPAAWFAYFLIVRNLILHTSAKYLPKVDRFLLRRGRIVQKFGMHLYQNEIQSLSDMHS
ncbi:oxygenase MpaB family protein [uncultured Acinetobacter sp.]|uniref:oxygenase MpaB family protein n=1 Tax=uncultured Acinetobacter sp. TaxID=165433 RepID=UPI00258DED84|nr:oxygenase MpaB family protein [uncultured Acinetobacter sp.]